MPSVDQIQSITADGADAPTFLFLENEDVSNVIDFRGMKLLGLEDVVALDGKTIKFRVSNISANDVKLLSNKDGLVSYTVANLAGAINFLPQDLCAWRYVQLLLSEVVEADLSIRACARGL